jgi:hypothetical protein
MSENTQDNDLPQVSAEDELAALKQRATMMGIQFHPSIGLDKLREKVNAAVTATPEAPETPEAQPEIDTAAINTAVETPGQKAKRLKDDAARLVRIRIQCMNPAKTEWPGEIISVGNSVVGNFSKYVPFGSDEGWHVPNIIYKALNDRMCQVFTTQIDSRGNKTRKGKLIKEFAIEILPDLTPEELHDLAQRQAMSGSIDNS